jgi:hypothetical protein
VRRNRKTLTFRSLGKGPRFRYRKVRRRSGAHGGLRPPGESSLAPNGIPTRPTDDGELIPPGGEVNAAAGDEVDAPDETIGDGPNTAGLSPGVASSVAPIGIPTDPTGEPGPMPTGKVTPSGELGPVAPTGEPGAMPSGEVGLIPPTCAQTGPQPKSAAVTVAINKRVIVGSTPFHLSFSLDRIWARSPNPTNALIALSHVQSECRIPYKLFDTNAMKSRSQRWQDGNPTCPGRLIS